MGCRPRPLLPLSRYPPPTPLRGPSPGGSQSKDPEPWCSYMERFQLPIPRGPYRVTGRGSDHCLSEPELRSSVLV